MLLPDDPVFASKFFAIEEPLLHSLHYLYVRELDVQQATVVDTAYVSWGQIEQRLPPRLQYQRLALHAAEQQGPHGYTLHDPLGRELPSLYAVEVDARHLDRLRQCQHMLEQAERDSHDPLAEVLHELANEGELVEGFGRALAVIQLKAPPRLLHALRNAAPAGPDLTITLDADRTAAYREFCGRIVHALSAGDRFSYTNHRALYFS